MIARETEYYLPRQTARLLTEERIKQCGNLGLLLDKYVPQRVIQESRERGTFKSHWLQEISKGHTEDRQLAESIYRRWLNLTTAMSARHFRAVTESRLVVGLGGETVVETDLTLHSLYGLPFVPGSALKGVTRAYVTGEIAEHKSARIDEDDETIQRIFGSERMGGTVIFFDAMPLHGRFALELDIINVHYAGYYSEKKLPTNDQHPNPVTFLTVADSVFVFALAARHPERQEHRDDVPVATKWLQEALQEYGIGGKTSAGYGYFTLVAEEHEEVREGKDSP
jgi:CRISPR type III-B/RAMP module RAMP protein Cmr6